MSTYSNEYIVAPCSSFDDNSLSIDDLALPMLLIILKVSLVVLILRLGVKLAEAALHAAEPLSRIVVSCVPEILALTMSRIHVKLAFIVAILEEHASIAMLIAL